MQNTLELLKQLLSTQLSILFSRSSPEFFFAMAEISDKYHEAFKELAKK